jgi:hypothetical protein
MWLGFGLGMAERCKGYPLVSDLPDMPRNKNERVSSGGPDELQLFTR